MAKLWTSGGKLVQCGNGKIVYSESCPYNCYFRGFIDSCTFFTTATIYDWDCCLFGDGIYESPYGYKVDGHFTYTVNLLTCGLADITDATGSYSSWIGRTSYLNNILYGFTGNIINNTKRDSNIINRSCCNGDGTAIFIELSGQVYL